MTEKRVYPRVPIEVDVEVIKLVYPVSDKGSESVKSVNITSNGICFISENEYSLGDILNLRICLQGLRRYVNSISKLLDESLANAPLSVVAKVVWSKAIVDSSMFKVGASFESVNSSEHEALIKYLACLSTDKKAGDNG